MKTKMMEQYEKLTGEESIRISYGIVCPMWEYVNWLEAQLIWLDAMDNPPDDEDYDQLYLVINKGKKTIGTHDSDG
jgi:hypothetical protein